MKSCPERPHLHHDGAHLYGVIELEDGTLLSIEARRGWPFPSGGPCNLERMGVRRLTKASAGARCVWCAA